MTVLRDSTFRSRSALPGCSLQPTALVDALVETIKPRTALDVWCGTAKALDYFLAKGVDCFGVEGSTMAVGHAVHPERITVWNLNKPYQAARLFDLVWCFEVAEHIHPSYVCSFLDTMCSHGPHILLSAAHPGQGGVGHFNEQPPSYWIRKLAKRGFDYDGSVTEQIIVNWKWYPENIMFFRRRV